MNDCYTTPEGLATQELVNQYLKEHVEMAHVIPIKLEAEEKKIVAQVNLIKAQADKIRAEQPPDQQAPPTPVTTAGPKTEKNSSPYDRRRSLGGRLGIFRGPMGEVCHRDGHH